LLSIVHETSTDKDHRPAENQCGYHPVGSQLFHEDRRRDFASDVKDVEQSDSI
jgi:hypothetical protein